MLEVFCHLIKRPFWMLKAAKMSIYALVCVSVGGVYVCFLVLHFEIGDKSEIALKTKFGQYSA